MRASGWLSMLALMPMLGGCGLFRSDPTGCEAVADHDPAVEDYTAKGAGNPQFVRNHKDDLDLARLRAVQACERGRGIMRPGGGVEVTRPPR